MPNIASSRKRVRTTANRTAINTARKTRVRGYIRKVEEALAKGDKAAAQAAMKAAEPEIMRGVSKGILHKNTGSRKVSRLSKRIAKLGKSLVSFAELELMRNGRFFRPFLLSVC